MKRFVKYLSIFISIVLTMFLFATTPNTEPSYQVVPEEYLHTVDSLAEAQTLATTYQLDLISVSDQHLAVFRNTTNDNQYLLDHGFSYNSYAILEGSPWKTTTTEDPYFRNQYGLEITNTIDAWGLTDGSSNVTIAIIDTGIDITHPEFAGRISTFSKNIVTGEVGLNAVIDDYGHGTMVAGIIGAIKDNSIGIAGITQNTTLLVIKANEPGEGSFRDSSVINAIYYAIDQGADVINVSLGTSYANPDTRAAVQAAVENNILVVGATGNDGTDQLNYPASFPEAISVSAVDSTMTIADYSNHNQEVDLSAPGSDIVTTSMGGGYMTGSGTSFAAPHVTGIIALYKSLYPGASANEIIDKVYASAIDLGTSGLDAYYGYGMIDAYTFLAATYQVITYETGSALPIAPDYVLQGTYLLSPPEAILTNQVFLGWYTDAMMTIPFDPSLPIMNDITLYAKFTDAYHTVHFSTPSTPLDDLVVPNNETFTLPTPSMEGYRFVGWYLDESLTTLYVMAPVSTDLTLYAKFDLIIYYQIDYYVAGELYSTSTVEENKTIPLPIVAINGYSFVGWYLDADLTIPYTSGSASSDLSLYAKMVINRYTVTLNADGNISSLQFDYQTIPDIPDAVKSGYEFAGWYLDSSYTEKYVPQPIIQNLTLYAKFANQVYVIELIIDDTLYDKYYVVGTDIPVLPMVSKDGSVFSGWYLDSQCQTLYEPASLFGDITLYAGFDPVSYLIRFFDGNNNILSESHYLYNERIVYPNGPAKSSTATFDYTFESWSTDVETVTGPLDIYPVYSKTFKPESVTLNPSVDTLFVGDTYTDAGVLLEDETLIIDVHSNLDTNKAGKYEIDYLIYDQDELLTTLKRFIRVTERPVVVVISLNPGISTLFVGEAYVEPGATSNIGNVVVHGSVDTTTAGTYYITYEVDIEGVVTSRTRVVCVLDPNIVIQSESLYIPREEEYDA